MADIPQLKIEGLTAEEQAELDRMAESFPTERDDMTLAVSCAHCGQSVTIYLLQWPQFLHHVTLTGSNPPGRFVQRWHCPHCEAEEHKLEIFGSGGGARVAATLSQRFGYDVPVLGEVPLGVSLREGGDAGKPVVEADPTSPAAKALNGIARGLSSRGRGLAGMQLGLTPSGRL